MTLFAPAFPEIRQGFSEALGLAESVESLLATSNHQQLRNIRVSCGNRTLRLDGKVTSFFLKQIATETIRSVMPIEVVLQNNLLVDGRCLSASC